MAAQRRSNPFMVFTLDGIFFPHSPLQHFCEKLLPFFGLLQRRWCVSYWSLLLMSPLSGCAFFGHKRTRRNISKRSFLLIRSCVLRFMIIFIALLIFRKYHIHSTLCVVYCHGDQRRQSHSHHRGLAHVRTSYNEKPIQAKWFIHFASTFLVTCPLVRRQFFMKNLRKQCAGINVGLRWRRHPRNIGILITIWNGKLLRQNKCFRKRIDRRHSRSANERPSTVKNASIEIHTHRMVRCGITRECAQKTTAPKPNLWWIFVRSMVVTLTVGHRFYWWW